MPAFAVVGEDLNDPAFRHPSVRALGKHALQLDLQGGQAGDPLLGLPEVGPRECIGRRTGLMRLVLKGHERPNSLHPKTELAGMTDEG